MQQTSLTWANLNLSVRKDKKPILNDLHGSFNSGDFVTIMGPSGAGKSSLLSVLTARITQHHSKEYILQGECLLNGVPNRLTDFSAISCYVQQDDLFFGTLTLRQTFAFHAKLKLWHLTSEERSTRCYSLLKKLNLLECRNNLVGNSQFKKCISGGQKKRLAIGIQLLSNPLIMIFDEPTSGLDSHNSLIVMRTLLKLAKQEGKLVIATLHQPSTLMFRNMDTLYLLKEGAEVYYGPANQVVPYMQNLNIKVNYRMNPADFFMLEIKKESTPMNKDNAKKKRTQRKQNSGIQRQAPIASRVSTPFTSQIYPLLLRAFRNFYRSPSNQLNKIFNLILFPCLLSLLYVGVGSRAPAFQDEDFINKIQLFFMDFSSCIFLCVYFIFAMNVYDTVLIFPTEKEIVLRETNSQLYSILAYFFTRMIVEMPGALLPPIIGSISIYYFVDLDYSAPHFFIFVGIFILMGLMGYFFGMFFGVLCKNPQTGITLLTITMIPFLIFGGLPVNLLTIPDYVSWMQYLSPIRHAYYILTIDQLNSNRLHHYGNYDFILQRLGIEGNKLEPLMWQLGLLSFFVIGTILLLHFIKR